MIQLKKCMSIITLLIAMAYLTGCATPSQPRAMKFSDYRYRTPLADSVSVLVGGGIETSATGMSNISNADFASAISQSLLDSGVFKQVLAGNSGDYLLSVSIVTLQHPLFGSSFSVKMETAWRLTKKETSAVVWERIILSEYTASMGDALIGVTRLRLAKEGAAKESIKKAIMELGNMTLEKGTRYAVKNVSRSGHGTDRDRGQSGAELAPLARGPGALEDGDSSPPKILVQKRFESVDPRITIHGAVRDESEIANLMIGGEKVEVSDTGTFSTSMFVPLGDGLEVRIEASDVHGNRAIRTVAVARREEVDDLGVQLPPLDPLKVWAQPRQNPSAALIIGIERYRRLPSADHARADAYLFQDFAHRALGVPRGQTIRVLDEDADNFGLQDAIRRVGALVTSETDLYVFFAGHGFASGEGAPYLLPHDGDAAFLDQLPSRKEFFGTLAALDARSVTLFLDTCYSGRGREGDALAEGLRPLIVSSGDEGVPQGFTVISAAGSDQFSGSLPGANHGLFSYYLMRGLQGEADENQDRTITVSELHGFIAAEVSRQASRMGHHQTPQLFGERSRVLVEY